MVCQHIPPKALPKKRLRSCCQAQDGLRLPEFLANMDLRLCRSSGSIAMHPENPESPHFPKEAIKEAAAMPRTDCVYRSSGTIWTYACVETSRCTQKTPKDQLIVAVDSLPRVYCILLCPGTPADIRNDSQTKTQQRNSKTRPSRSPQAKEHSLEACCHSVHTAPRGPQKDSSPAACTTRANRQRPSK